MIPNHIRINTRNNEILQINFFGSPKGFKSNLINSLLEIRYSNSKEKKEQENNQYCSDSNNYNTPGGPNDLMCEDNVNNNEEIVYFPDSQNFSQIIDIDNEKYLINKLKSYCQAQNTLIDFELNPFILPLENPSELYPNYRIKYGAVAELIAVFPSEIFLKKYLYHIYSVERQHNFNTSNRKNFQIQSLYIDSFYNFVGKYPRELVLNHFSQISIIPEIQTCLGKTIRFKGLGNNFVGFDRLFIREKLSLIVSSMKCFVDITLILPCTILENRVELFIVNIGQKNPREEKGDHLFYSNLYSADLNIILPDSDGLSNDIQHILTSLQITKNKQIISQAQQINKEEIFFAYTLENIKNSKYQFTNYYSNNERLTQFTQSVEQFMKSTLENQKLRNCFLLKFTYLKGILFSSLSLHGVSLETTKLKLETHIPQLLYKIRSMSNIKFASAQSVSFPSPQSQSHPLLPSQFIKSSNSHLKTSGNAIGTENTFRNFAEKSNNDKHDAIFNLSHNLINDCRNLIEVSNSSLIFATNNSSPSPSPSSFANKFKNFFDFCKLNSSIVSHSSQIYSGNFATPNGVFSPSSAHQFCIRTHWVNMALQISTLQNSFPLIERFPTISQIVALSIKQKFDLLLENALNQLTFIQQKLLVDDKCKCNEQYSFLLSSENFRDIDEYNSHILFNSNEWISRRLISNDRFQSQIFENSFQLNNQITPDVNCQFKSISYQLFGSEEAHSIIRILVMTELLRHYQLYSKLLRDTYELDYFYLLLNIQSGDHITLYAISTLFNVNIVIFSPLFIHPIRIRPLNLIHTDNTIYLAYVKDKVYLPLDIQSYQKPSSSILLQQPVVPPLINQSKAIIEDFNVNVMQKSQEVKQESEIINVDFNINDDKQNSFTKSNNIYLSDESSTSSCSNYSFNSFQTLSPIHLSDEVSSSSANRLMQTTSKGIERRRKVRKIGSCVTRTIEIPSLSQLCIQKVIEYVDYLPNLDGVLPEELIQRLASHLITSGKLNDVNLEKILDPSITRISLVNCKSVRNSTCSLIAQTCPNLKSISLSDCINITSEGIVQIARSCTELESIDLEGCCNIDDVAVRELSLCCPQLVSVNFAGCLNITNETLKELSRACTNIENLSLKKCVQISDPVFEELGNKLRNLDLSECNQITDNAVLSISRKSERLTSLKLSGKQITDKSVHQVAISSPNLRELELNGCENISDYTIQCLARGCPELNSLCLSSCKNITLAAFQPNYNVNSNPSTPVYSSPFSPSFMAGNSPTPSFNNLQYLDLTLCVNVTDEALDNIADRCPNLLELNLSSCEGITDKGLTCLVKKCRNIQSLYLYRCIRITDDAIVQVANHCRSLKKLSLRNCNITDYSILQLTKHCHEITDLDLSSCDKLTDESISQISVGLPLLESLSLEEISLLTDNSISTLLACSRIHTLKLAYCKNITQKSITQLVEGCQLMQTLDLSYCNQISLDYLFATLSKWKNLKNLSLKGIHQFTVQPNYLEHKNLEVLNLSWCKSINDDIIIQISKSFPRLNTLDIAWCSLITSNAILQLIRNQPQVATLNLRGCSKIPPLFVHKLSSTGRSILR